MLKTTKGKYNCTAIKATGACWQMRKYALCNCSCPQWPGGCTDVVGWASSSNGKCQDMEGNQYCSRTTADHLGPLWDKSWGDLSDYANKASGLDATEACCACGGGVYPATAAVCNGKEPYSRQNRTRPRTEYVLGQDYVYYPTLARGVEVYYSTLANCSAACNGEHKCTGFELANNGSYCGV